MANREEAADAECTLLFRQAVVSRPVSVNEPIPAEFVFDPLVSRNHARMSRILVAQADHHEECGIYVAPSEFTHITVEIDIEAAILDALYKLLPYTMETSGARTKPEHATILKTQQIIKRHPAHHLRK